MTIPTQDEIQAYIDENKYNLDAKSFWLSYDAKDWKTKAGPMVRWKSAVSLWAHNGWGQTPQSRSRWAKHNVQVAQDAREQQEEMYGDYLRGLTIRALKDKRRDPGALGHVIWLINEVLAEKGHGYIRLKD